MLYFITLKKMEWREGVFIYKHKHVPFTRGGVLERMYQTSVHLIRVPHVLSSCYLRSCQGSKWLDTWMGRMKKTRHDGASPKQSTSRSI